MEAKFYRCAHCGNIVFMVEDAGVNPVCCGEKMGRLVPASQDASLEKHVPVVSREAGAVRVAVGSVAHPMTDEHHIAWVALVSGARVDFRYLEPGEAPEASFPDAEGGAACAYCNLHGLWSAEF